MSRNQRLTFLGIAAVIAVVAIVVLTTGDGSGESAQDPASTSAQQTATPTATESAGEAMSTPTPTPTPKPKPPLLQAGKVTELRFTEGETARFRVRHDAAEEVHIHGYNIAKDLEPNQTITVSFPATITGIFEIELEHSGEQIGELRVDPK